MKIFLFIIIILIFIASRMVERRGAKGLTIFKKKINSKHMIISWLLQLLTLSFLFILLLFLLF